MRTSPLACAAVVAVTPVLLAPAAHASPTGHQSTVTVRLHASGPAAPSAATEPGASPLAAPAASSSTATTTVAAESGLADTGVGAIGWIIGAAVTVLVVGGLLVRRMSRD
ncbi:hypothetical protein [Streptomyces sp. NPDC018031]|uniref:hypothetical protein n=1 Tax=Streptomyces sp. NPDC018031 TaxID=3365033 RepID=UPI0037A61FE6